MPWSGYYESDRYGSLSSPFFRFERHVFDPRWRLTASGRTVNGVCKNNSRDTVIWNYLPGRSLPQISHGVCRVALSGFDLQEALCLGRSVILPKHIPQRSHLVPLPSSLARLVGHAIERLPARVFLRA